MGFPMKCGLWFYSVTLQNTTYSLACASLYEGDEMENGEERWALSMRLITEVVRLGP